MESLPSTLEELPALYVNGHSSESESTLLQSLDEYFLELVSLPRNCVKRVKVASSASKAILDWERPRTTVGTLTAEERKTKILKYLEKKKNRKWSKRISYDCRKRVAENRLRIKGRFVTKKQAIAILGADHDIVQNFIQSRERNDI